MQVWINGRFVERDAAVVSVFDAGFQHAVGLFETMLARNGRVFRAEHHMHRLADSARELRLSDRLRIEPLVDAVNLAVRHNGLADARVRLTLTGGDLNLLQSGGKSTLQPTIVIVVQPPTKYPDEFFEHGVMAAAAEGRVNPLDAAAGHKTLNYWQRIRALQDAAARRAGEALWFSASNHLVGGCVSNAFIVKDGALLTPLARGEVEPGSLPAPALPGITRGVVRDIAAGLELELTPRLVEPDDVLAADELFLTNSSWGVLPVIGFEGATIGSGAPGPITRQVREAWLRMVDQETRDASL